MSAPQNPDPADIAPDEDDAAIDEALQALTSGMSLTATADEDEELGEDTVGASDDDVEDDDDVEAAGFTDDDAADDVLGALEVPMAADAPINFEEPGEEEGEVSAMPVPAAMPDIELVDDDAERRLARLERFAAALIDAEEARENSRVKRKVQASAGGAASAGAIPIILQLVGALDLSPELAATVAAGMASLASFVTGYFTPERPPALDPVVAHKVKKPRRSHK